MTSDRQATSLEDQFMTAMYQEIDARRSYDAEATNIAFDRVHAIAKQIRLKSKDGGMAFFTPLTNSDIPEMALMAAFFLIPLDPIRARVALKSLADSSFDAKMTLSEWTSGRLDPEWFMKK